MSKNTSKSRVIVGMSGGVDSAVSAHLLQAAGYDVVGLFMKNWDEDDGTEYCTAIADLESAQQACDQLGIELHTANFAAEYWDGVFADFLADYEHHRTPNPDVLCNREIKFKQFANYANLLGGDFIATGHYARIEHTSSGPVLLKGLDQNKDQSYFLQAVPYAALHNVLFPLGEWQKPDVRALAQSLNLDNFDRKDSTGICFIGERRFNDFLRRYINDAPGDIRSDQGLHLGEHKGLHQYTYGQRQGLGIGGRRDQAEAAWYVSAKAPKSRTLYVSQSPSRLGGAWLHASEMNWLEEPTFPLTCQAKIRYRQADQPCTVTPISGHRLLVSFESEQRAITPGQYIALYRGDQLLGGGRISVPAAAWSKRLDSSTLALHAPRQEAIS